MPRGFGDQLSDEIAKQIETQVGTPERVEELVEAILQELLENGPLTAEDVSGQTNISDEQAELLLKLVHLRGVVKRTAHGICTECNEELSANVVGPVSFPTLYCVKCDRGNPIVNFTYSIKSEPGSSNPMHSLSAQGS